MEEVQRIRGKAGQHGVQGPRRTGHCLDARGAEVRKDPVSAGHLGVQGGQSQAGFQPQQCGTRVQLSLEETAISVSPHPVTWGLNLALYPGATPPVLLILCPGWP